MIENEPCLWTTSHELSCIVELIGGNAQIECETVLGGLLNAAHKCRRETEASLLSLNILSNANDSLAIRQPPQCVAARTILMQVDVSDAAENTRLVFRQAINKVKLSLGFRRLAVCLDKDHAVDCRCVERGEMVGKKRALQRRRNLRWGPTPSDRP